MAGKQGRWAGRPRGEQPAGKLGTHGASHRHGALAPQQADTKRYPVVPASNSPRAKGLAPTQKRPARREIKSLGASVEETTEDEVTGTIELTSLEEITNVSAGQLRRARLVRRLPLPAPSDPGEDEEEYTDVQTAKPVLPELLELSESPPPLVPPELSESLELSESVQPIAKPPGPVPRVGPLRRKSRSAAQESTLNELDPSVLPSEVTRTIAEDDPAIGAPVAVPEKPAAAKLVAKAAADPEKPGASDSEMPGAMLLEPVVRRSRRWLAVPLLMVVGVGAYVAIGSPLSASETKAPGRALATDEADRAPARAAEPLPQAALQQVISEAAAQPSEEAEMVLDPGMVIEPGDVEPETIEDEAESEPAKLAGRAKREPAPRAENKKSERRETGREDDSSDEKPSAQQFYKKGISAFVGGKLASAEREFQNALKADPGFALALRGLGLVYERQGEKAKAVGAFRRYLKRSPRAKDAEKVNARISRLGG